MMGARIVSNRSDGFGVRLSSLINAIMLSDIYKMEFRFTWKGASSSEFHSVLPAENTFSKDFLSSYLIESSSIDDPRPLVDLLKPEKPSGDYISTATIKAFLRNQDFIDRYDQKNSGRSAFEKIGFSEHLVKACEAAYNAELPESFVAIHLRAGDVIFGMFREYGFYSKKVITYPVAISLIEVLKSKGFSVLLFSQDLELGRYLRDKFDIILSNDLLPKAFDAYQESLFDICLMSRCNLIYGANSGFSIAASIIGAVDIVSESHQLSEDRIYESMYECLVSEKYVENFNSRHYSFAVVAFIEKFNSRISDKQIGSFALRGLKFDPENMGLWFLLALSCSGGGGSWR